MADEMPDTGGVVREEAARQAVVLAAGLVFVALAAVAERWLHRPDALRDARMTAFKTAERGLARAAGWCWQRAERARRAYESERS